MSRRFLFFATFAILLRLSCGAETEAPSGAPIGAPSPAVVFTEDYQVILDAAWQTVNDKFYDPTFGGKDWRAIGDEYREKLDTVEDGEMFLMEVLNPMLFELGVSHLLALPVDMADQMDPSIFATGSLGMDVRHLDGEAVVTRVDPDSPADKAGIRMGYVITSADGMGQAEFAASAPNLPPYNERHERAMAVGSLRSALYGEVGAEVEVEYLDGEDCPQRATMKFAPREGLACGETEMSLPPVCAAVQTEMLEDDIAYLRLSGFLEPALEATIQAIDELHDAPALIFDIRGNPGGQFFVRKAIASQLDGLPRKWMRYRKRDKVESVYLDRVDDAYQGRVVILVDELSASSSEEFSGSLQSSGRATIVGTQTQGNCLVADFVFLPGDVLLMYPYAQSMTPDGRVLEDNGVVPDIEVALDRASLLEGRDLQLEAVLAFMKR